MYIEDEYTELKIELTKDIKKEIIAFANTKGGKIYIGIDDNGNIIVPKDIILVAYVRGSGKAPNKQISLKERKMSNV